MNSPLHFARLALPLLACFALTPPVVRAKETKGRSAEVSANAELTEEGRKRPPPTPDHPVYYVPITYGWHEEGALVAGEVPPKRADLLRHVGQALAKEGYVLQALRPDANTTLPALIITVEWGYMNPVITNEGALDQSTGDGGAMSVAGMRDDPTQRPSTHLNQREMLALVAGSAIKREAYFTDADWQKLNEAVVKDRYYIIVSAFDFAASIKGEQVLLWRTRMSTPRQGVWMNDVVPALVLAGTPLFGRQSDVPQWREFRVREGRVELGDLKVLDGEAKLPAEAAKAEKAPAK